MPIRFRRTFHILPGVRINISRGGISTTIGPRGAHLTFNKQGVRQTVGLPGTGLSESSYLVKNEADSETHKETQGAASEQEAREVGCFPWGCLAFILVACVIGYFGAGALHLLPPNFLSDLLRQAGL
jgi:hypothetical protein